MADKLNPKLVSFSLVIVATLLSLLCALVLTISPNSGLTFLGNIFHGIDLTKIASSITLSGVMKGLVAINIVAFVTGWTFAIIYNYMSSKINKRKT